MLLLLLLLDVPLACRGSRARRGCPSLHLSPSTTTPSGQSNTTTTTQPSTHNNTTINDQPTHASTSPQPSTSTHTNQCDNLLCDLRDLNKPVVKIGDLGLSKTKTGSFVSGNMRGTLPWMAPELFPSVPGASAASAASAAGGGGGGGGAGGGGAAAGARGPEPEDRVTEKVRGVVVVAAMQWQRGRVGRGQALLSPRGQRASRLQTVSLQPPQLQQPHQPPCKPNHNNRNNQHEPKVDVFSFGVCLWEIWTLGEQPYPSLSLQEIFAGVMTGTLRPGLPAGCDPAWASLMTDCWHGAARLRPAFSDVVARLEAMLARWNASAAAAAAAAAAAGGSNGGSGGGAAAAPAAGGGAGMK